MIFRIALLLLLLFPQIASAVVYHTYSANSLIGGVDGSLDNKDGTALIHGDIAIVVTTAGTYHYTLNAASGAAESSPDVITPDANAGAKRWILVDTDPVSDTVYGVGWNGVTTVAPSKNTVYDKIESLAFGTGDVTAAANIDANAIVLGDDGAKGVKKSVVLIDAVGRIDTGATLGNSTYVGEVAGANDDLSTNSNTCVGGYCLNTLTTGHNNNSLGLSSLFTTNGDENVAMGNGAMGLATGSYNVCVGGGCQFHVVNDYNISLGYLSGRYVANGVDPNTTSANSLYLGGLTKASALGVTNEITIGHETTGSGSNTVTLGNDSIANTYLKGDVETAGTLEGKVVVAEDTDATVDLLTASECRGHAYFNADADAIAYTLPPAEAGLHCCFANAENAGAITVDPDDGVDTIILEGVDAGAGAAVASTGVVNDMICILARDDTYWVTFGVLGTWGVP